MSTKFNERQQEVIDTLQGPVMAVSCPGSGKTTVVIERTKALLDSGISPENILVITFTNASAQEMYERFVKKYGTTTIRFSTIHSVCLFILKKAYQNERLHENLISTGEQMQVIQQSLHEQMNRSDLNELTKSVLGEIGYIKNRDIDINTYKSKFIEQPKIFRTVYKDYEKYKSERKLLDMDDILLYCKAVLEQYPHILAFWQNKYQYLMIDEYQDTNSIQAQIFYMIAGSSKNICVVGDDDQGIYRFRAADSSIMLNFDKEFPNCKKIFMDTNYRSGSLIIEHANNLIRHNKVRFEKDFKCGRNNVTGEVNFIQQTKIDTIKNIVQVLKQAKEDGKDLSNYGILYRNNYQGSLLLPALNQAEIPFTIADTGMDIHNNTIYYDILAYYNLAIGKKMYGDFAKVVNKPNRYLSPKKFMNIEGLDRKAIMQIIDKEADDWKRRRQRDELDVLITKITKLGQKTNPKDFFAWLEHALKYLDWLKDWCDYTGSYYDEQYEIWNYLKEESANYDTMQEWFHEVDRIKRILKEKSQQNKNTEEPGVRLTTFHSSKGLEWDTVFILDANEGLAPSKKATTEEEIEEERRLFYVAMTRAKNTLNMYAVPGKEISRFIREAGEVQKKKSDFTAIISDVKQGKSAKPKAIPKFDFGKVSEKEAEAAIPRPEKKTKKKEDLVHVPIGFGPLADMPEPHTISSAPPEILEWYIQNIKPDSKYYKYVEIIKKHRKTAN